MNINELIKKLRSSPDTIEFNDVIDCIAEHYNYTSTQFRNGSGDEIAVNEAGTNEGSCKIFAFAQLNHLNEAETLACFGQYYREDVLQHPEAKDHANIRNFIRHGWAGIQFDGDALVKR